MKVHLSKVHRFDKQFINTLLPDQGRRSRRYKAAGLLQSPQFSPSVRPGPENNMAYTTGDHTATCVPPAGVHVENEVSLGVGLPLIQPHGPQMGYNTSAVHGSDFMGQPASTSDFDGVSEPAALVPCYTAPSGYFYGGNNVFAMCHIASGPGPNDISVALVEHPLDPARNDGAHVLNSGLRISDATTIPAASTSAPLRTNSSMVFDSQVLPYTATKFHGDLDLSYGMDLENFDSSGSKFEGFAFEDAGA